MNEYKIMRVKNGKAEVYRDNMSKTTAERYFPWLTDGSDFYVTKVSIEGFCKRHKITPRGEYEEL